MVKRDYTASNGYVHVIDKVLFPPSSDAKRLLSVDTQLQNMNRVLPKTLLELPRAFTLFLPIDDAFRNLLPSALEEVSKSPLIAEVGSSCNILLHLVFPSNVLPIC